MDKMRENHSQDCSRKIPRTTIIKPPSGWFDISFMELWRSGDLIRMLVKRDFVAVYKQTILGPLWYLIQPLLMTSVFVVVFSLIVKIPTDGLPPALFYLAGLIIWRYFSECLTKTSNTFVGNIHIFSKVYFPRLAVPISVVISNLIPLLIQLALFIVVWIYFKSQGVEIALQWQVVFLPLLVLQLAVLGFGCGIVVSSLTTKYRDFAQLVGFGVQLWLYLTPIVYPANMIPDKWQWVVLLNPMAFNVEMFRFIFFGVGLVTMESFLCSAGLTIFLLFLALTLFSRVEKSFVDTV